jgi:hypothetical protein
LRRFRAALELRRNLDSAGKDNQADKPWLASEPKSAALFVLEWVTLEVMPGNTEDLGRPRRPERQVLSVATILADPSRRERVQQARLQGHQPRVRGACSTDRRRRALIPETVGQVLRRHDQTVIDGV